MSKKKQHKRIPHKYLPWIDARKKFQLSHAHIQMARELGMNPKRFPSMANRKDQPWKLPLPEFIESLYEERFGKRMPDIVKSMEEFAAEHIERREKRKAEKVEESEVSQEEPSEEP